MSAAPFGVVGSTIRTRSGHYLDLLNPRPEQIDIKDIAGALSKICRFGGQIERFYSVAQHSLHCAQVAELWYPGRLDVRRAVLMHDAAEAYIGDIVKPLKCLLDKVEMIESLIEGAIATRFGIDFTSSFDEVRRIDQGMLIAERDALFSRGDGQKWTGEDLARIPDLHIESLEPHNAEIAFLYAADILDIR
ncbi:hypothetical protein [Schlesneria sp.]|uniref:hypothetical protein n=1 Tax=Schlesneria sp. TaxID=2762018 RepID=UPI002F096D60